MPGRYTNVHRPDVRKGAGDARPTALDIVRDENLAGKLKGKSALVTGTSSGIGIETARALAATGMHVFCTARNVDKGRKALADIKEEGEVELIEMDQSSLASVRKGAAEVLKKSGGKLNIFVANAGIMAGPYAVTQDGFEAQFGTNHLSHFLLFQLIKDALLAGSTAEFNSRVVVLSSSGHLITAPKIGDYGFQDGKIYDGWAAYGQSKTANIWMANEIERQYGDRGLHALSLHPGGIETGLQVHIPDATKQKWAENQAVVNTIKSRPQGASTTTIAAIGKEFEGRGGIFLEDCEEAPPYDSNTPMGPGYAPHAFDPEGEKKLWEDSLKMIGL